MCSRGQTRHHFFRNSVKDRRYLHSRENSGKASCSSVSPLVLDGDGGKGENEPLYDGGLKPGADQKDAWNRPPKQAEADGPAPTADASGKTLAGAPAEAPPGATMSQSLAEDSK